MSRLKKINSTIILGTILLFMVACSQSENNTKKQDEGVVEEVIVEEDVIIEEDVWLIDEHQINDVAITNHPSTKKSNAQASSIANAEETVKSAEDAEVEEELQELEYDIATMEAMDLALAEAEYEAKNTIEVTEVIMPLDEVQTVVSYGKKGEPLAEFQVISGPDGEVEQILFMDKKHQDVYNVQAGMTGKEVKKLRKELKHMVKKGQVFLYDDKSNIMYLMDVKNMEGDEVIIEDIETMEVQAVIWKDKKHHKE